MIPLPCPEPPTLRWKTRVLIAVGAFFFYFLAAYFANLERSHNFTKPPGSLSYDPVRYVNVALCVMKGKGLWLDFSDPDFRRVYEAWNQDGGYDQILRRKHAGPSTFTPPGYPIVLGYVFKLTGFQPHLGRWLSLLFMSSAVSLAVLMATTRAGWVAGGACLLALLFNGRLHYYGGDVQTEAPAALMVMLLAWIWHLNFKRRELLAGLIFGALIFTRANFLIWLPFFVVALAYRGDRRTALTFLAGASLVLAPWFVRNCVVSGAFQPLPTNGRMSLSGGYSDGSYENWGGFDRDSMVASTQEVIAQGGPQGANLAHWEWYQAEHSQRLALQWARQNWTKLPALFVMRCLTHLQVLPWRGNLFEPYWKRALMWLSFLFAVVTAPANSLERLVGSLMLVDLLAVGVTWALEGRLLVPLLPLLHVVVGLGVARAWRASATKNWSRRPREGT